MADIDARLIHKTDQIRAQLAELVGVARDHRASCLAHQLGGCAGTDVWDAIRSLGPHGAAQLLFTAVAELAKTAPTNREGAPSWE